MRDSFVSQITDVLARDADVALLTGDLGFGIFDEISARFADRFINVGVAEQNMIGVGSGMAIMGKKVFCYSIANFVFMRGLEQFRNGAIYHEANVTLVCSGGGFTYGQLGFTHFAIEDYGILSSFGAVDIIHPATSEQVRRSVRDCASDNGPSYLRLEKAELAFPELETFGPRAGLALHRDGKKVAIVAVGSLLQVAMEAAERAAQTPAVFSLTRHREIADPQVQECLRGYERVIVIEEHVVPNSVGQKLAVVHPHVEAMAITDNGPAIVGDQQYLRNHYGLTAEGILSRI